MVNWKDISAEFNAELQKEWENGGFSYEEAKKWIEMGFKSNDLNLLLFAKSSLGYESKNCLNSTEIEILREIYEANLKQQSIIFSENLIEQETIRQSLLTKSEEDWQLQQALLFSQQEEEQNSDKGWLTDDNITYILENSEIIEKATDRNVQIKTDIANIYFQIEEAKQGQKITDDFWDTLDTTKKHIMLPLRVSGNHWSLLIIIQNEVSRKPWYLNYISSLSYEASQQEVEEIKPFLQQIQEKFKGEGVFLFDKNDKFKIINRDNPRQPNTWDCGVYLCLFVEFLSQNELYLLDEESPLITSWKVKEFREKWKNEIGEEKWCEWDNSKKNIDPEDEQLKAALALSLTISEENNSLPKNVVDEANETTTKIIDDLSKQNSYLTEKTAALEKENEELRKELTTTQEGSANKEMAELKSQLVEEKRKNSVLSQELEELKKETKQKELEEKIQNCFTKELWEGGLLSYQADFLGKFRSGWEQSASKEEKLSLVKSILKENQENNIENTSFPPYCPTKLQGLLQEWLIIQLETEFQAQIQQV